MTTLQAFFTILGAVSIAFNLIKLVEHVERPRRRRSHSAA